MRELPNLLEIKKLKVLEILEMNPTGKVLELLLIYALMWNLKLLKDNCTNIHL